MNNHSILLVDDETNVLKSLKRLFIDTEYKIYTAESADDGLQVLKNKQINLVISDYKMPYKNGVQFLKEVKEKYPKTIRMILSGFADVTAIVESINEGNVYKFLAKPWNDQELLVTIQRALEHFNLQQLNDKLVDNLQNTNKELIVLTEGLEKTIAERTADLEIKNKALKISQYILNLLPIGTFGVDSDGMVVYINKIATNFLTENEITIGSSIKNNSSTIGIFIKSYLEANKETQEVSQLENNINALISPLSDGAGLIVVLYSNETNISMVRNIQKTEVENV